MVYGLENFEVDIQNDNRLKYLEEYYNKLVDEQKVSQYDITLFENKMKYDVLTKFIPIKSYTVTASGTNYNRTLYYLKKFKEEYSNIKRDINNDKEILTDKIYNAISNIGIKLETIHKMFNNDDYDLDTMYAAILAGNIRTKTNSRFDNLVESLNEYSEYCKIKGINNNFFNVSSLDIIMKLYKTKDLSLFNIAYKEPIEIYCIDTYNFLKHIIHNPLEDLELYTGRLNTMVKMLNNLNDEFTCNQYKIILDAVELSNNFLQKVIEHYKYSFNGSF